MWLAFADSNLQTHARENRRKKSGIHRLSDFEWNSSQNTVDSNALCIWRLHTLTRTYYVSSWIVLTFANDRTCTAIKQARPQPSREPDAWPSQSLQALITRINMKKVFGLGSFLCRLCRFVLLALWWLWWGSEPQSLHTHTHKKNMPPFHFVSMIFRPPIYNFWKLFHYFAIMAFLQKWSQLQFAVPFMQYLILVIW